MKMIGLARLGADAELKHTPAGMAVASLNLAFNHGKEKKTQWISAAIFGKRAESTFEYLKKGTLICVTLSDPHIEEWEKKDGSKGFTMKAIVDDFEFAGGKPEPREDASPKPVVPARKNNFDDSEKNSFDNFDDDIPF